MDMDFAGSCTLVRPTLPPIRFLFVRPRLRSTLPSDGPSRFRPCALLVLHLHQVAQGTFTPRALAVPSTRDDAKHRRRRRREAILEFEGLSRIIAARRVMMCPLSRIEREGSERLKQRLWGLGPGVDGERDDGGAEGCLYFQCRTAPHPRANAKHSSAALRFPFAPHSRGEGEARVEI